MMKVKLMNEDKTAKLKCDAFFPRQISGSDNYEEQKNKPQINGVELIGNLTNEDLGIDQDFVKDDNYVHTDNNFTSDEKEKLENLKNYVAGTNINIDGNVISAAVAGGITVLHKREEVYNSWELEDGAYIIESGVNFAARRGNEHLWKSGGIVFVVRNSYDSTMRLLILEFSGLGDDIDITILSIFKNDGSLNKQKYFNVQKLLLTNNTTSYDVTQNYQPAHKLYVDKQIEALRKEILGE